MSLVLKRLDWDSSHFQFSVAEISNSAIAKKDLVRELSSAKRDGVQLIYWESKQYIPQRSSVLQNYNGLLADKKATFRKALDKNKVTKLSIAEGYHLEEYPNQECTDEIERLGMQAGVYSRFCTDPNIPKSKFEELYRVWIRRSTLRELASQVLVIRNAAGIAAGLITFTCQEGVGKIGLITVDERHRSLGLGKALVLAAHTQMLDLGAHSAEVVTQADNRAACQLYYSTGHSLAELTNRYHFWLNHNAK